MRQRENEMARAERTVRAHREQPTRRPETEFDRERQRLAALKRERRALRLRKGMHHG